MKRFGYMAAATVIGFVGIGVGAGPAFGVGGVCNPTPTPTVSIDDDFVYENQVAQLHVTLTGPSCSTIKVDYNTSNGSAVAVADYVAKSGTLTFSPGQTSKTVNVTIVDDDDYEGNENFYVMLKHPVSVLLGDPTGKITISGLEPAG